MVFMLAKASQLPLTSRVGSFKGQSPGGYERIAGMHRAIPLAVVGLP
jgi:hypothetical protein